MDPMVNKFYFLDVFLGLMPLFFMLQATAQGLSTSEFFLRPFTIFSYPLGVTSCIFFLHPFHIRMLLFRRQQVASYRS